MCDNCNPSHRTIWTRSFVWKIMWRFITSENRTELSIENFHLRCWFAISKTVFILYGSNGIWIYHFAPLSFPGVKSPQRELSFLWNFRSKNFYFFELLYRWNFNEYSKNFCCKHRKHVVKVWRHYWPRALVFSNRSAGIVALSQSR